MEIDTTKLHLIFGLDCLDCEQCVCVQSDHMSSSGCHLVVGSSLSNIFTLWFLTNGLLQISFHITVLVQSWETSSNLAANLQVIEVDTLTLHSYIVLEKDIHTSEVPISDHKSHNDCQLPLQTEKKGLLISYFNLFSLASFQNTFQMFH